MKETSTMKRTITAALAGLALLLGVGLTAPAASAAPAVHAAPAIASVIPSNCFQTAFYNFKSVDSAGHTVDADAVEGTAFWNYSTSGASAALGSIILSSTHGVSWLANSTWAWGGISTTGKSLSANGNPQEWDPSAHWYPLSTHPYMYAHFYNAARPAVGVTVIAYPCNF